MSTPTTPAPRVPRRSDGLRATTGAAARTGAAGTDPVRRSPTPASPSVAGTDDYVSFIAGFLRLTRIDLEQYKRAQMERRIRSFAERRGEPDLGRYLRRLQTDRDELEAFLDRITINVSQLWRHPEQFRVLREKLLPELCAGGSLRVWSAGCSYGAEAYTLAAEIRRFAERSGRPLRAEVHGTDIDERMVARAREGRFTIADAREAPQAELRAHFEAEDGGWRASKALRAMTTFRTGDLLRMPAPRAGHDLVFCRNTVIYFNEEVRDALHSRLAAALRPGGYLVIGATERVADAASHGLRATHPFIYRKTEA